MAPSNNKPPQTINDLINKNISVTCPYCHEVTKLIPQTNPINDNTTHDKSYFVAFCGNRDNEHCKPLFAIYSILNNRIVKVFPFSDHSATSIRGDMPYSIKQDLAEAKRCITADAYKASAVLFRRTIEGIACDKLKQDAWRTDGKTKNLSELIKLLVKKNIIANDVEDFIDLIKFFGDHGAHVQKQEDNNSIDFKSIKKLEKITDIFIDRIYRDLTLLDEVKDLRDNRIARTSSSK